MSTSVNDSPRAPSEVPVGSARTAPVIIVGFVGIIGLFVGWFVVGMPGMDHSSDAGGGHAGMSVESMRPAAFGEESTRSDVTVINVHRPYEGELPGTDTFIAYDQIANAPTLPRDDAARILLYCRSGTMSELAARTLMEEGYTNVAHLRGGMDAWVNEGRNILRRPP
jgi:rhodanese-related sulfurtransferase